MKLGEHLQIGRGSAVDLAVGLGTRTRESLDAPLELGDGVFLEPLDPADLSLLLNDCRVHRLQVRYPLLQHGYALVAVATDPDPWDAGGRLWAAINLSRLVWHNVLSQELAAQVTVGVQGTIENVRPAEIHAPLIRAYAVANKVAYPTRQQAAVFREIFRVAANRRGRGGRVGVAMRNFADAAFMYYPDQRTSALVKALEALVNTRRQAAQKQFVARVAGISRLCVGDRRYGRRWAARVYKIRNSLSHGRRLVHHRRGYSSSEDFERAYLSLIADVEECVRSILLAAHTKRDVLRVLQRPRMIAAQWPVGRERTCSVSNA